MGFDCGDCGVEGVFGELVGRPGGFGIAVFAAQGGAVAQLGVVDGYGFILWGEGRC